MPASTDQVEMSGAAFVPVCVKVHGSSPPRKRWGPSFNRQLPKQFPGRLLIAASIVSGLSTGFSAYSHEIESAFAVVGPAARSAPFVPLCPKVPDLLENQDRWLGFSDDFRALTLLGRQYHRSHYC